MSIADLLAVVDAYRLATGRAETTVAQRFLGRGDRVAELRKGGDMGSRKIERVIRQFASEWPEGAQWPDGVERPVVASNPEAA